MTPNPNTNTASPSQQKRKRVANTPPPPQRRRNNKPEVPALPEIPEEIIDRVFSFLPVKQAIKASSVAKRYARCWRVSRHLVFHGKYLAIRPQELVRIVDEVLASHSGPEIITLGLLADPECVDPTSLERWLRLCVRKGLQILDLEFFTPSFTLFADFMHIPTLRILKLNNCNLELPADFQPLQFLQTVSLRRVHVEAGVIQLLMNHSEMLQRLELVKCSGFQNLYFNAEEHRHFNTLKIYGCTVGRIVIDAPTLKSFFYFGYVTLIRLVSFTPLDEAYFHFVPQRNSFIQPWDMELLVSDIFNVKILSITAPFIEALAARVRGTIFRDAIFLLGNVKEIQLIMEGGSFCNAFDISLFIKHCPNLETLFIDMNGFSMDCEGAYWFIHQKGLLESMSHQYTQLKFVKLIGFNFSQSNLELVKIILQRSTTLEALFLVGPKNGRKKSSLSDPTKYTQLFQSWRTSAAKVVFYQHRHDRSDLVPTHDKLIPESLLYRPV